MTNTSYESVYICDIDEPWDWVSTWYHRPSLGTYALCTLIPRDGLISKDPYSPCLNFATIIASHVRINPSAFRFDIADIMVGFVAF